MSSPIYCIYCHHHWKIQKDYEKHIHCCEYFYNLRKNPPPEMDDHGIKLPTVKELYRLVQDLSYRLDRSEKKVAKLEAQWNTRQKKVILEWLNQPSQLPETTFEDWYREMDVEERHVLKVRERDLTTGMQAAIEDFLQSDKTPRIPIRTFTQKPNLVYVYSKVSGTPTPLTEPKWRIMSNPQMEGWVLHLSQLFLREFLKWQKKQESKEDEDERDADREILFMMKINGTHTSSEKRIGEIKKWVFCKLEENLRAIMDCEFE